jgi:hypothetical protein
VSVRIGNLEQIQDGEELPAEIMLKIISALQASGVRVQLVKTFLVPEKQIPQGVVGG